MQPVRLRVGSDRLGHAGRRFQASARLAVIRMASQIHLNKHQLADLARKLWAKLNEAMPTSAERLCELIEGIAAENGSPAGAVEHAGGDAESLIDRADRLDRQGHTDLALDLIYDSTDQLMRAGAFSELDTLLATTSPDTHSLDLLLGVLTATLPAKSRLPTRSIFLAKVEATLRQRGDYEDGLLAGLS